MSPGVAICARQNATVVQHSDNPIVVICAYQNAAIMLSFASVVALLLNVRFALAAMAAVFVRVFFNSRFVARESAHGSPSSTRSFGLIRVCL